MIWNGFNKNGIVPMPDGIVTKNGGTECDMAAGPCSCGAWHSRKDWQRRITDTVMGYSKMQKQVFQKIIDIVDGQECEDYKESIIKTDSVRCLDI